LRGAPTACREHDGAIDVPLLFASLHATLRLPERGFGRRCSGTNGSDSGSSTPVGGKLLPLGLNVAMHRRRASAALRAFLGLARALLGRCRLQAR